MYLPSGDMAAVSTLPSFVTRVIFIFWKCAARDVVEAARFLKMYTTAAAAITSNTKTASAIVLYERTPPTPCAELKLEVGALELVADCVAFM